MTCSEGRCFTWQERVPTFGWTTAVHSGVRGHFGSTHKRVDLHSNWCELLANSAHSSSFLFRFLFYFNLFLSFLFWTCQSYEVFNPTKYAIKYCESTRVHNATEHCSCYADLLLSPHCPIVRRGKCSFHLAL